MTKNVSLYSVMCFCTFLELKFGINGFNIKTRTVCKIVNYSNNFPNAPKSKSVHILCKRSAPTVCPYGPYGLPLCSAPMVCPYGPYGLPLWSAPMVHMVCACTVNLDGYPSGPEKIVTVRTTY